MQKAIKPLSNMSLVLSECALIFAFVSFGFGPSFFLFCNHEVFFAFSTMNGRQRIKRVVKYGGIGIRVIKITIDHEIRFALFCFELLVMQILPTSHENINNNKKSLKSKYYLRYILILFQNYFVDMVSSLDPFNEYLEILMRKSHIYILIEKVRSFEGKTFHSLSAAQREYCR